MKNIHRINGEIYITSQEDININDFITDGYRVWRWKDDSSLLGRQKIVMSSDKQLDVQEIKPSVLSFLAKNLDCEYLEIDRFYTMSQTSYIGIEYEILLPKRRKKEIKTKEISPEQETLEKIKFVLSCNNESQARTV